MKLKKTISSVAAGVLSLSMVFAFTACGDDDKPAAPEITAIALDPTEATIATGESTNLKVTATYSDSTTNTLSAGDVEWTSSKTDVATVTRGIVSGKAAGETDITAKVGELTASCSVTVYSLVVEISATTLSIEKGETAQLTATVKKDGVALPDEQIEWSSSDENIAEVNDSGLIKAWVEGTANITAKRKNGNQFATCEVSVVWENKGEDVKTQMSITEQNKIKPNSWGYWADEGAWEFGNTKVNEMYTDSHTVDTSKYEPKGDGDVIALNQKANLDFTVLDHSGRSGESNPYAQVQLAFRSAKNDSEYSDENAMLLTNHNYRLTFKLDSNVAGEILVNPISFLNEHADDEDYEVPPTEIVEGTNSISLEFRHGDWGEIHPDLNYDNVESALFLQLGNLPLQTRAVISIYDIIWEDLGEAEVKTNLPTFDAGDDDPAELPELTADPVALPEPVGEGDAAIDASKYTITTTDEGKSYNIVYTDLTGGSYDSLYFAVPESAKDNNVFAVTITNNGDEKMQIRFDVMSENAIDNGQGGTNNDLVTSAVATKGKPNTDLTWCGTTLDVAAGDTVTLYLTYVVGGEKGNPTNIRVQCNTHIYEDENTYSGNVTISDFTFDTVEEKQLVEGETYEAVYTGYNNDGDTLAAKDTWGVWYVQDAGWGCGDVITLNVSLDADAKSCTLDYNANGNVNQWGIQLRYQPTDVVEGQLYKVSLKINTTAAYSINLNGKAVALEVGDNDIEVQWTAGTNVIEGNICNANSNEDITLVISNLNWTELNYAD